MAFSATDAAFEGFRIAKRKPLAIVLWAVVYIGFTILSGLITMLLIGSDLMAMSAGGASSFSDPAQILALSTKSNLASLLTMPLSLFVSAVFAAAVYRAVLQPNDDGFAYLRFGADELRLTLLYVVYGALAVAAVLAVTLVVGVVMMIFGVAVFAGGRASEGAAGIIAVLAFLGVIVAVVVFIWLGVRLSLAGPMTFAERKLRLFESWAATKGRFWSLFGAYFLAGVLGFLVLMAGFAVVFGIVVAVGGAALFSGGQPDASTGIALAAIVGLFIILVMPVLVALYYAIAMAPSAVAYRELAGPDASAVF